MRDSSSFFWKSVLISAASVFVLNGCGATAPAKNGPDPYDKYYGQPNAHSRDIADSAFQHGDIVVNPSAPRTYVVQKGDTLWGIARKFLNTPWYWPEVWDKNQRIQNPHLIYPGDVLTLDYVDGAGGGKLAPRIRIERGGREGQPISSLMPFMAWPRVLDEATIDNAPYIIASQDDHYLITEGERIYVRNLRNVHEGSRCAIFHKNKPLLDPQTGALLGYEVTYAGYSRVERPGDPATATVLDLRREARRGDRLLAPTDETRDMNVPIQSPNFKVRGDVVALFDAEAVSGNYMIATINKGLRDNIRVGHTLGVYAQGKHVRDPFKRERNRTGAILPVNVELPPEKVANMVVYKVTDKVSYGLILDATRETKIGDKIGNP